MQLDLHSMLINPGGASAAPLPQQRSASPVVAR